MGVRTYFAYGSNMSLKRLRERVPSAKPIARGILRCHRLEFHKKSKDKSGKCDIVLSSAVDVVWGRVYEIDDKQKKCLDRAEGLSYGYCEKHVTVELDCGTAVRAVTYYADPKKTNPCLKPYTWYVRHVLIGAKEAHLPPDYIKCLEAVDTKEDCNKFREAIELVIYSC